MYFNQKTENAIREYCTSNEKRYRDRIFKDEIYPALNKLVENVIHNRKFYNYGFQTYADIKHECVVHLLERLEKFNPDLGHKAFSYFNRVVINWVYAQMKNINEEMIDKVDLIEIDNSRDVDSEVRNQDRSEEVADFCKKWSVWGNAHLDYLYYYDENVVKPFTKKDKAIANAVFDLFQDINQIDLINKKALYIMIRERIDVKTDSITNVVKVLKPLCKDMYLEYIKTGTKYWHRHLYYPESYTDDSFI